MSWPDWDFDSHENYVIHLSHSWCILRDGIHAGHVAKRPVNHTQQNKNKKTKSKKPKEWETPQCWTHAGEAAFCSWGSPPRRRRRGSFPITTTHITNKHTHTTEMFTLSCRPFLCMLVAPSFSFDAKIWSWFVLQIFCCTCGFKETFHLSVFHF